MAKLCLKCGKEFPYHIIINGIERNLHNRKYCLNCSPFNVHNTKQLHPVMSRKIFHCLKCGETDQSKFYGNKNKICSKCQNEYNIEKSKKNREFALNYLGGKCVQCGFNKYSCSLDIHHVDPSIKDPNFRHMRGWSIDRLVRELKNCIILCKNCHSAFHTGFKLDKLDIV